MEVKLFSSHSFVMRMSASTKNLWAVGLIVLIVLSYSLVSAVTATRTSLDLPSVQVNIEVFNGTQSFFDINLSNVPAGYDIANGTYLGWCVDRTADMTLATIHNVSVYSTDNPPEGLAAEKWDMVNYILNHKQGNSQDIQEAIWYFVNFGTGYSPTSSVAWTIVNDTLANGDGFVPGPGQTISIICLPRAMPFPVYIQITIIELTVPSPLIGDVTGPNGQPDGEVNMRDLGFIARHFGETVPPAPSILDLYVDRIIDMNDINLVAGNFGGQSP